VRGRLPRILRSALHGERLATDSQFYLLVESVFSLVGNSARIPGGWGEVMKVETTAAKSLKGFKRERDVVMKVKEYVKEVHAEGE
jgi:hypothetical protein